MKIVHVNNIDLHGARFNGHNMQIDFNKRGISCKQFVIEKLGNDPNTISLSRSYEEPFLRNLCMTTETDLSLRAMLYPYGWRLLNHPSFKRADVVHYHLLHNNMISYAMFPELSSAKPSILTIHDPWLLTGHCIHPINCVKWERHECKDCPHLDRVFSMNEDNASYMWELKKAVFANLDIDLVVASKWMYDMVRRSPITSHFKNVHLVPFGIDTSLFTTGRDKAAIRLRHGIPQENVALFFRSDPSLFKGLAYIQEMLEQMQTSVPITLLTVGQSGVVQPGRYGIIEKGWVDDEELMADLYAASDIFLMPSVAEAFGVMAIEAMATGLPVVVFEGTALPDVTFAPDCGIVVENNCAIRFAKIVERLVEYPEERQKRGCLARTLAVENYDTSKHYQVMLELYKEVAGRKRKQTGIKTTSQFEKDLAHFRHVSLLISNLSDEYKRLLLEIQRDPTSIRIGESKVGLSLIIMRQLFRLLRRISDKFGIKESLKKTKLYRRLLIRGTIKKLK